MFSKLAGKVNFSERKFEEITSFKEPKSRRYIWENVYFGVIIFAFRFPQEIKGFYQSSLRNKADFRDIMNVSPNILTKN